MLLRPPCSTRSLSLRVYPAAMLVTRRRQILVDNKDNAVQHAKNMAKEQELGQVIVHKRDGTIAEEFTYGADPRNIPG